MFVDFDAAHDAGAFHDKDTEAYLRGSDDLHLCETCVRQAAEILGFKPELHRRQLNEIRKLELARDHFLESAKREKDRIKELEAFIETRLGEPAPKRGRKAA